MDIIQGQDFGPIAIVAKDDNGNPYGLSNLIDYQAYVYYVSNGIKNPLLTYKLNPLPSTDDKSFITLDSNTFGFILDRDDTASFPVGELYVQIAIMATASAVFDSSQQKFGIDFLIGNMIQSPYPTLL